MLSKKLVFNQYIRRGHFVPLESKIFFKKDVSASYSPRQLQGSCESPRLTPPSCPRPQPPLPLAPLFPHPELPLLPSAPHQLSLELIFSSVKASCYPTLLRVTFSLRSSFPSYFLDPCSHMDTCVGSSLPSSLLDSLFSGPLLSKLRSSHFILQSHIGAQRPPSHIQESGGTLYSGTPAEQHKRKRRDFVMLSFSLSMESSSQY